MTDLHDRLAAWLDVSPHNDPPRDVAVHAAFCADCQRRVAALDALAAIDVGTADELTVPSSLAMRSRAAAGPFHIRPYARVLSAVVLGVATGLIVVRSVSLPAASGPASTPTPIGVGAVLGSTGTPLPSSSSSVEPRLKRMSPAVPRSTPAASATVPALPPTSVPLPLPTLAPVIPGPTPTASPAPTPSPVPSLIPEPTPTGTPVATPSETQSPGPSDTPSPTPSETAAASINS
jgi:hypothetical protein